MVQGDTLVNGGEHPTHELIVTSRRPFLDGARALLARGYEPSKPYNMRLANPDVLSFLTTTIVALKLTMCWAKRSSATRIRSW
jgi:hypothetical protein